MPVEIAAWNIARRPTITDIPQADVVVLSEAPHPKREASDIFYRFEGLDKYTKTVIEYEDEYPHPTKEQYLVVLTRKELEAAVTPIRLGIRNAIAFDVEDPHSGSCIHGVGAHFDDRCEENRLSMVEAFLDHHGYRDRKYAVLAGDLNAMYGDDFRAKVYGNGLFRTIMEHTPHEEVRSLGTRLSEMAMGSVMQELVTAGFTDADPEHKATIFLAKRVPIAQLDHIMYKKEGFFSTDQKTGLDHGKINNSDHLPIRATLWTRRKDHGVFLRG